MAIVYWHPEFPDYFHAKGEDFTKPTGHRDSGKAMRSLPRDRMADLLLIDDIQFIAGKERTQRNFSTPLTPHYEVLDCSHFRPSPQGENTLEDRMKTRFEWVFGHIQAAGLRKPCGNLNQCKGEKAWF